jgi:hypothetical protein
MLKFTVMIPSNLSMYGVNIEKRIQDKILYVVGNSDYPL